MAERANLALGIQTDTSGDRSADEIRRDIAATRDSIKDTVGRLNDRVEMALDWRTYVADSPFVCIRRGSGSRLSVITCVPSAAHRKRALRRCAR